MPLSEQCSRNRFGAEASRENVGRKSAANIKMRLICPRLDEIGMRACCRPNGHGDCDAGGAEQYFPLFNRSAQVLSGYTARTRLNKRRYDAAVHRGYYGGSTVETELSSTVRRGKKPMGFRRLRRWSSKVGIRHRDRSSTASSACSTLMENTRSSEAAPMRPFRTAFVVCVSPHARPRAELE